MADKEFLADLEALGPTPRDGHAAARGAVCQGRPQPAPVALMTVYDDDEDRHDPTDDRKPGADC